MNNEDIRASLEEMLKAYKLEEGALKESLEKIDAALYDHVVPPFSVEEPGFYTVRALVDTSSGIEVRTLSFAAVDEGSDIVERKRGYIQVDTCHETCRLQPALGEKIWMEVIIEQGSFYLDTINYIKKVNHKPYQVEDIPSISVRNSKTIDLSLYFIDPDNDILFYDSTNPRGVSVTFDGSLMTISGEPGSYMFRVYVNDLEKMIESETFTVNILG